MFIGEKLPPFRILMLITTPRLADRASELLTASGTLIHFRLNAFGTAPSEMMDLLGLGDVDKALLIGLFPRSCAEELLRRFKKELKIGSVNSGIAFTLPVRSGSNLLLRLLADLALTESETRKEPFPMTQSSYALIAAIVTPGYSNEVMNAARGAGAGGGTVLHSRQIADEAKLSAHGVSIQEEKEIVLIVTDEDRRAPIMNAISAACGMQSDAKGQVISLPIDAVKGLGED